MVKRTSAVLGLSVAAFAVAIFGLCTQIYFRILPKSVDKGELPVSQEDPEPDSSTVPSDSLLPSLYDVVHNDPRLSRFQQVLSHVPPDIISRVEEIAETTLFVPIDDAFAYENVVWDDSPLHCMFLAFYHHAAGNFSHDYLKSHDAVPTHLFADIFQSYGQLISTQYSKTGLTLNHRAAIVEPDVKTRTGYIHLTDRILMLPNSTAYITRNEPEFSLLRKGLDETELAEIVYDTSTHNGQTFFAPSNTAFKKLGKKVNQFLFSPWGRPCLRALLEYHVIANQTLFTNFHFEAKGRGPGLTWDIEAGTEILMPTLIKPLRVKASIIENGKRGTIILNDAISVVKPDIVVQDGVIHRIDDILLPPKPVTGSEERSFLTSAWGTIWSTLFQSDYITVEELAERFHPYIDNGGY